MFSPKKYGDPQEEKLSECMQGLPFVQLGVDASPIVRALQIAKDEEGLHQTAIFLQGAREGVLTRIRLHATDEQRRGDPASFEGACHPEQIIPGTSDQVLIDRPFEQRLDMLVRLRPIHAVEPLLPQVANTWCELQAEQIEEGKHDFGKPSSICRMFDNRQLRLVVQNFIQHVGRIAAGRRGNLRAVLRELITRPGDLPPDW